MARQNTHDTRTRTYVLSSFEKLCRRGPQASLHVLRAASHFITPSDMLLNGGEGMKDHEWGVATGLDSNLRNGEISLPTSASGAALAGPAVDGRAHLNRRHSGPSASGGTRHGT